jgi:hypothetical protein
MQRTTLPASPLQPAITSQGKIIQLHKSTLEAPELCLLTLSPHGIYFKHSLDGSWKFARSFFIHAFSSPQLHFFW